MNGWVFCALVWCFVFGVWYANDKDMKVCQLSHSYETCHHTLYR